MLFSDTHIIYGRIGVSTVFKVYGCVRLDKQISAGLESMATVILIDGATGKRDSIKDERIRQLENNEKLYIRAIQLYEQSQEGMESELTMLRKEVEQMKLCYEIEIESQLKSDSTEEKQMTTKTTGEKGLGTKGNVVAFLESKSRQANE
ncbi:unnamed protein product [Angiostrongylus costaricensis]|uniref:RasGAP_C domain-containing protein n=1 Tax=Angiostrongylus costaricensis TaxID=334426 RepID=A0A0R3PH48_ANGCS|nr:unnamed protein product [Angiostrongylus costaricensis]